MYYYEVLVATKNKTNKLLTYVSESKLASRQIVRVPVRHHFCSGLIIKRTIPEKISPDLRKKCREITQISPYRLPTSLVQAIFNFGQVSALSLSAAAKLLLSNAVLKPAWQDEGTMPNMNDNSVAKIPILTVAQKYIYMQIKEKQTHHPQLLLGINGSGKTRIYAELIQDQVKAGRSSLILVPEIGLSAQVLEFLRSYLPFPIDHFHSQLKIKQRRDLWEKCQNQTQPLIIVGPRSAEFLPFKNLGLIVLDEFHDDSFKQDRQPIYHSLQLASHLAKAYNAQIICGSATPKVEDYYHFQKAGYPIYHLAQKALPEAVQPQIIIVDKKEQKRIFSQSALDAIISSLKSDHQSLIFYNRRGDWRLARCDQCFWQAECPTCSKNLVFHRDKFRLICHKCQYSTTPISVCPDCRQAISYSYPGLKTVTRELQSRLLEINLRAPLWRFDSDNLKQETLVSKFNQIKERKNLILLGTQIISQGLDLPNLQTVVILDADQSLVSPDYRTEERYYRHIHQLSGRVGRGHLKETRIIIQTYQPEDSVLNYALKHNWLGFYQDEIARRQKYQLPPFIHFANISVRRSSQAATEKTAQELYEELSLKFKQVKFYEPAPASQNKHAKYWEWLIHTSCQKRKPLIELATYLKDKEYFFNLDPGHLFTAS